jgi:hypothetical protein
MLRFALRGASIPRQVINSQKRFSGGGLKHNIPIEENQGLREITYWTWDFEFSSLTRLVMYLFLPGYFLMESVKADFVSNKLN